MESVKLRSIVLFSAVLCTSLLLLSGCGNKGELYLPPSDCERDPSQCQQP
ncbi:MAG: LPS translocon maturation chaperone LptM [Pseudomonadota bacterium]